MKKKRQGPERRIRDPVQTDTMTMRETRFADEVTRHSYQLALQEMDARIGDAGLTAVVTLQTSGEVTIDATRSGAEGADKVRKAARRAGANHAMAADWLRQLARITRGVKRGTTVYSGPSLTLTTGPGKNTGAGTPQNGKQSGSRDRPAIPARSSASSKAPPASRCAS